MGKFKSKLGLLPVYMCYLLTNIPMQVYASESTSDAVSDIMNHERFQGAIENIMFLTNLVDYWFTMVITATAFFIISAAMLKNACAGAYVSNHKFWDKVAEAHEKTEALSLAGIKDFFASGQFWQATGGGVRDFLLSIVPNIKAMTDFDDADIEPKQYFTKAIPQMIGCVIIGVFIYNGYYRDAASTVGNFGSEICNRVFSSMDPEAFLDKLTQTTRTPENIFAKDQTQQGKDCYTLSMSLYKSYISIAKNFTNIDSKTSLMRDCEKLAMDFVSDANFTREFYSDGRLYDFTMTNVRTSPCSPNQKTGKGPHIEKADKETNSKFTVVGYESAPNTVINYIDYGTQSAVYVTFVMTGSQKQATSIGLSSITTAAGTWNNSVAKPIEVTLPAKKYLTTKTTRNGVKVRSGTVPLKTVVPLSKVTSVVESWCKDNDYTLEDGSVDIRAYNNWDIGPAADPSLKFSKVTTPASKSCEVRVSFNVTTTTDETTVKDGKVTHPNRSDTITLTIPVKVTLQ